MSKETNPKDQLGSLKLPLHLWPMSATAFGCIGLANGMLKYGRSNWRHAGCGHRSTWTLQCAT